ncbi:unnamed protein product, partial [Closterium sp. NIES-53]
MHSRILVSGLPRSLPPLTPSPAPRCLPCVEGRQRAAPHSSSFPPTTAPLHTLHIDVWGPASDSGKGRERYFLLVVDDYTLYTTVFPLRSKGEVVDVFIPWIRAVRLQLREKFHEDLPVLRLHSERGGEFSSDLLRDSCRGEGILQSFTLPDSPQQNGIAERRIGLFMEVARTSMIHAASPHFLWPFTDESVPFYCLFPYRSAPPRPPPLFLAPGPPPVDTLTPQGLAPSGVSQVDPLPGTVPVQVAGDSGAARGVRLGVLSLGVRSLGALSLRVWSLRVLSLRVRSLGWLVRRARLRSGAAGAGATGDTRDAGARGAGVTPGAGVTGGTAAADPGGARTRGTGAAGTGGVGGAGAGDPSKHGAAGAGGTRAGSAGAGGAGAGGTGAGGAGAGGAGAVDPGAGGAGAGSAGDTGAGGTVRLRPRGRRYSHPPHCLLLLLTLSSPAVLQSVVSLRLVLSRLFAPLVAFLVCVLLLSPARMLWHFLLPLFHCVFLCRLLLSPLFVPSLNPESDLARAASPTVSRLLATVVTDPSFDSTVASALVAELLDFAAACRLEYAAALVGESESSSPPSVGGECGLGTDVFEDRQEDFECLAAAVPRFASMLLAPEGDPDAPDIPTPRSYAKAITSPYSSQSQAAIDAKMASWKSTCTYVDAVPPSRANIVDCMWIFG